MFRTKGNDEPLSLSDPRNPYSLFHFLDGPSLAVALGWAMWRILQAIRRQPQSDPCQFSLKRNAYTESNYLILCKPKLDRGKSLSFEGRLKPLVAFKSKK